LSVATAGETLEVGRVSGDSDAGSYAGLFLLDLLTGGGLTRDPAAEASLEAAQAAKDAGAETAKMSQKMGQELAAVRGQLASLAQTTEEMQMVNAALLQFILVQGQTLQGATPGQAPTVEDLTAFVDSFRQEYIANREAQKAQYLTAWWSSKEDHWPCSDGRNVDTPDVCPEHAAYTYEAWARQRSRVRSWTASQYSRKVTFTVAGDARLKAKTDAAVDAATRAWEAENPRPSRPEGCFQLMNEWVGGVTKSLAKSGWALDSSMPVTEVTGSVGGGGLDSNVSGSTSSDTSVTLVFRRPKK